MFLTSDVLWCFHCSLDVKDESLSCLVSSVFFLQAFFPLFFFLFFLFFLFWAIQPIHYTHTHTNPINHLPPAAWRPSKKIFFNIQGRQVAGGSSDLLGCVCVCCMCVGWWSLFTSSVSLHSLSIHCHYQFITTLFFFPCRSSTGEKGELSLHPSIHFHPFFSNPVVILLFLPLCSQLVD